MALSENQKVGLLLGGATALFFFRKSNSEENKSITSSGGGSGGIFAIPSGFGTNEVSVPLMDLPNVFINEAPLPNYNPPATETKKTASSNSQLENPKYITDNSGKLLGIQDSVFSTNPQSRKATAKEELVYYATNSTTKKSASNFSNQNLMSTASGIKTESEVYGNSNQTSTKKEVSSGSPTSKSSFSIWKPSSWF